MLVVVGVDVTGGAAPMAAAVGAAVDGDVAGVWDVGISTLASRSAGGRGSRSPADAGPTDTWLG